MPGLLNDQTPEQIEIARLEAAIAQFEQQNQGIASQLAAPGIADDTRMGLENSQQQRQFGISSMQGLLSQAANTTTVEQSPEQQEIASLEAQIAQMQGGKQSGPGNIEPTISKNDIQSIYGLLAGGADDPAAIGNQYVSAMQGNDQYLAAQSRRSGFNPIVDDDGNVWFPSAGLDGTTKLTRATDPDGKQIKIDPRYAITALGGGQQSLIATSSGAQNRPQVEIISATEAQNLEETAADIEFTAGKKRGITSLESMIFQAGGPYETITSLIEHPSRALMTGKSTMIGTPASWVPGFGPAEFRALRKKAASQAFIDSIAQLRERGGTVGQVTEMEGAKLENARLSLVAASTDEQFLAELNNFKIALQQFIMVAREEAGLDPYAPHSSMGMDFRTGKAGRFAEGAPSENRASEFTSDEQAAMDELERQLGAM